jgi:hypothetical protein
MINDAFQAFNTFSFRGRHEGDLRQASETSVAGSAFREAVLNYGRRDDFLALTLDFSGVEMRFIQAAARFSPDTEPFLLGIHRAVHAYCDYVDEQDLYALAMDGQQLGLYLEAVSRFSTFDF